MTDRGLRILCVPVSGAFGRGEYARSLAIADAVLARFAGAEVQFVLSRQAPYAATAPFPSVLLDSSPTYHSAAVIDVMTRWRPDVVIFDNAGRTAQLRAAKRLGARIVFISARRRQRRKAFRLSWMRMLDEHWIAYPEFIAGGPSLVERFKLKLLRRPTVRYLDVILARRVASSLPLAAGSYMLVVPGGGTGHPGASDAIGHFQQAARRLAEWGITTVFVGPTDNGEPRPPALHRLDTQPQAALAELMHGARVIIVNGGSTLLQAIACGKACVAVPIAGDQQARIERCVEARVALAARLDAASIVCTAAPLWEMTALREALEARAVALNLADGVEIAMRAIAGLRP